VVSSAPDAPQHEDRELPLETLSFLLPSRYCGVDSARLHHALILSGCWMPRPEAQFFSGKFQSHENID